MPTYRFFAISSMGVRTVGRDLQCLDSAGAMVVAQRMTKGYPTVEIWLGAKMIGLISAPSEQGYSLPPLLVTRPL